MRASSDPRPRIRWIPVLLGLVVALGLLYLQVTRGPDDDARVPEAAAP